MSHPSSNEDITKTSAATVPKNTMEDSDAEPADRIVEKDLDAVCRTLSILTGHLCRDVSNEEVFSKLDGSDGGAKSGPNVCFEHSTQYMSLSSTKSRNNSAKSSEAESVVKYVSKQFYEKQKQKLEELCAQFDRLCKQIEIMSKYIKTLEIEDVADIQEAAQQGKPSIEASCSEVSQVQSTHTGKQGLAKDEHADN